MKIINCLFLNSFLFFLNSCNQINDDHSFKDKLMVEKKRQNEFRNNDRKIKKLNDISFDYFLDSLLNSYFIDDSMLTYIEAEKSIELFSISDIFNIGEVDRIENGKILFYKNNKDNALFLKYPLKKDTMLLKVDILTRDLLVLNTNSTKIVHFPTKNLTIAIKGFPWAKKTSKKTTAAIFFLDSSNLIPKFSFKRKDLKSDSLLIEKYLYEESNNDLKAVLINFNKLDFQTINDISLEKLYLAGNDYNREDFKTLGRLSFLNGGVFRNYPLWSDYGGIYPFPKE